MARHALMIAVVLAAGTRSEAAAETPVLETLAAVRALSPHEASASMRVEVDAVVTFVNRADFATYGFVQAGDDAIYVQFDEGVSPPAAGHRVRLEATTIPGEFAPSLRVQSARDLGPGRLPAPAARTASALLTGSLDSRWVAIEGVVRQRHFDEGSNLHVLLLGGEVREVRVEVPGAAAVEAVDALVGARIRAEGACGARFNATQQLIGARVLSPRLDQIQVIRPAARDARELPVRAVGSLLKFDLRSRADGLARIRGTVTFVQGRTWVVQDSSGGVLVRAAETAAVEPGQRVDVHGYVEPEGMAPVLVDAKVIQTEPGLLPPAIPAQDLMSPRLQMRRTRVRGTIVDRELRNEGAHITLRVGDLRVPTVIARGDPPEAATAGTEIEVVGVVYPLTDPLAPRRVSEDRYAVVASEAKLLVIDGDQIRVVRTAPFWTAARTWLLIVSLLAGLLLLAAWGFVLRTQVRRQTRMIREQLDEQACLRQEAQAASEAKSLFLATMSHELRTPLHGILATAGLLGSSDTLSASTRDLVELIDRSGRQLQRIVGDILDLSKIEAGQLQVEAAPVEPRAHLEACLQEVRPMVEGRDLALSLEVLPSVPSWVAIDPVRLGQVVKNLLTNALKFTERGEIRVRAESDGPARLKISVTDTGPGIPPDARRRLFDRFHQVDASVTRRFGGTGLGLSICKELCALMGGTIEVDTELGVGSTFTFTVDAPNTSAPLSLGRHSVESPSIVTVSSSTASTSPSSRSAPNATEFKLEASSEGLRVLVADDNAVNRRIARAMLERLGCSPHLVEDGQAAVEFATGHPVDVILMDLHMPELDGIEATRVIREKLGATAPAIFAVTADALASTRQACIEAGVDKVLTKPLTLAELAAALASPLEGRG